jgi:hypothetical protein
MPDNKQTKKERTKRMKNPKMTSVLVGLGLVLVLANGYAQGNPHPYQNSSINTFINNTGQAVGGLHIEYKTSCPIWIYEIPETFASGEADGSGGITLNSGTVEAGGSIQISAYIECPKLTLKSWWWTDGSGNLVGAKHRACTNPDCTIP